MTQEPAGLQQRRLLNGLWAGMVGAVIAYALVAASASEHLRPRHAPVALIAVLWARAIAEAGIGWWWARVMLAAADAQLRRQPDEQQLGGLRQRLLSIPIVSMALLECPAIYGLVVFLIGPSDVHQFCLPAVFERLDRLERVVA